MNKRDLAVLRNKNQRKYHIPGQSHLYPRKRNAVFISSANSKEHEITKLLVCYELRVLKREFITEAVRNVDGVRIDVVDLDTGNEIEIVHKNLNKKTLERYEREGVLVINTGVPFELQACKIENI